MMEYFRLSHKIILCFCISLCCGDFDPACMISEKDVFTTRNNWMSQLPDNVQLSELALPGTHGSVSYLGQPTKEVISANQVLNIVQQLQFGIRAFDIRLLYADNEFGTMQRGRYLYIAFKDILHNIVNFLIENPTETVIFALRIEEEFGGNKNPPSTRLNDYLFDIISYQNKKVIYNYYLETKNANIKLEDCRGKFIILSGDGSFQKNSLLLHGKHFNVMDNNHLNTYWDLYKKWTDVKDHLELARKGDKNLFYVTYLTGYGGTNPYFVASGHNSITSSSSRMPTGLTTPLFTYSFPDFPRVGCVLGMCSIAFEGINVLARDKIQSYNKDISKSVRSVGIIMADFPGDSLIETIIENNYVLLK